MNREEIARLKKNIRLVLIVSAPVFIFSFSAILAFRFWGTDILPDYLISVFHPYVFLMALVGSFGLFIVALKARANLKKIEKE